ncbi:hypothetical protein HID58_082314 [Brassica napus]|uniref:Mitochondrial substrate carrier family protein n=1 Tax=Brassica napus TaxID=3708 RepID=A0ABQ7YA71_BRANA|nr:hypothetical protein HID58_082314 [Brassica napus]
MVMRTEARVSVSSGQSVVGNKASSHRLTQDQRSHIESASQLLAGGIAGAFSKTCTAPLSRLTILFQVQGMHTNAAALKKPSILHEASRILNEEGLKAFWKGNLVTIAHRLPYSSVNFYTYEHYKKFLYMVTGMENHRESISSNVFVHFVAGGLAGITAASATYPLDLVRTRLAAQTKVIYYTGIWHTLRTISTDEGILGLYKGLGTTLVGVGPSIAISFSAYESLRSYWMSNRPHDSPVVVSLACGSLSGMASSTVSQLLDQTQLISLLLQIVQFTTDFVSTFPLDLVRRRKQLEGIGGRAVVYKTGLFGTLKRIIKTEGVRGLYRGILPEYYKVVPGVGICFMTYETLKLYFMDLSSKL